VFEPRDREQLLRIGLMAEWGTYKRVINKLIESNYKQLADEDFSDMLRVGRLQGEITAFRKAMSVVDRRIDEVNREVTR
jgi:hypothetical protein